MWERTKMGQVGRERRGGGNFYNTQPVRVSKRFARTVIASTAQGRTPEPVALRMLGFSKPSTLKELGCRLGVG